MKRKILSLILIFAMLVSLSACQGNNNTPGKGNEKSTVRIASMKGPTSIGLVKLYDDASNEKTSNDYDYKICGTADEIATGLIKGELDAACVPANLASVLYNKTEGRIKIAAVNTLGVLYILSKGISVSSATDLKGQTIYTTGQGTTPEYTLRHILSENNIDPDKDVTIEYMSEAAEVLQKASAMDSAVVMLPEPFVEVAKSKDPAFETVIDLTKEWEKIHDDSSIVTGVLVVSEDFVSSNENALRTFLDEYRASSKNATANIEETASLLEKYDIIKAAIATKAIPYCNICFITGDEMISKVTGYFKVLFDASPDSLGKKLPDNNIFYIVKQHEKKDFIHFYFNNYMACIMADYICRNFKSGIPAFTIADHQCPFFIT